MVRRTKEDAEATRSQIIDAAELCFYKKGLSRTSLADIASEAGVTRGAIYWHFQDKADLLEALLERAHMPLQALSDAGRDEREPDPLGKLRALLTQLFRLLATDPRVRRINEILAHKCEYTDDMCNLRKRICRFREEVDQKLESTLRNAVARKQLSPETDVVLASRCLHGFVSGIVDQWLLSPGGLDLAAAAEQLADVALDLVVASPALRSGR